MYHHKLKPPKQDWSQAEHDDLVMSSKRKGNQTKLDCAIVAGLKYQGYLQFSFHLLGNQNGISFLYDKLHGTKLIT